jgi:hypothetical protein
MADEEFDVEDEPEGDEEELDVEDLEDDLDDDVLDGDGTDDDDEDDGVADEGDDGTDDEGDDVADDDDDVVVALDDETHPDDVEASLDVLLKERTTSDRPEDEEPEAEDDEPDRGDGNTKIKPRGADEFLCTSCFLVLPLSQLAAGEKDRCRDCA